MDCVAYKASGTSAVKTTNATSNTQQNGWEQLQKLIFLRNWVSLTYVLHISMYIY